LDTKPFDLATNDPFMLHKTTRRDVYDLSRKRTKCDWHATIDEPFDVIMWNQNRQISETSITNIAIRFNINDNQHVWKTPPVECGLLPGVFRSYLLEHQQENNLVEEIITIEDLKQAQKVNNTKYNSEKMNEFNIKLYLHRRDIPLFVLILFEKHIEYSY
jgi:branched-subunit amino acid aminotransferase/4-amino-4-deoxychorismate lyase